METITSLFDFRYWEEKLPELVQHYRSGDPFPHIVLDDFLPDHIAKKAYESFPKVTGKGWIHYVHFNEKKHGLNKN